MTEYVYKIPDNLLRNLQVQNSHLVHVPTYKNVDPNYVHIYIYIYIYIYILRYLEFECSRDYML